MTNSSFSICAAFTGFDEKVMGGAPGSKFRAVDPLFGVPRTTCGTEPRRVPP